MRKPNPVNLEMLRQVARGFDYLRDQVVFIGGAIVDLLITDPASPQVRASMDVDVIIETVSRFHYHDLREPLILLGFKEDLAGEGSPICRWLLNGISVDIMPVQDEVLGFSNQWYVEAIDSAEWVSIAEGLTIKRISGPSFLMTKLAAFHERGNSDFMASRDIEDIVAVLDGRQEIIDEITASNPKLKHALVEEFENLIKDQDFIDALPGHLLGNQRVPIIIDRIRMIITNIP